MKKNIYIAPCVEIIEIDSASMLAASPHDIPVVDGEGSDVLSNHRRGTWGSLWADEK